jgi:hypothetical protein
LNPQITLSDGVTVNEVTLNNNEINLIDNSGTGTTTSFSTINLSQTTTGPTTITATWSDIINTTNTPPTLADVLLNGNSAGSTDIDMSGNDIVNANAITSTANIDITSQTGDINLTADIIGSGFINMDATGGVVINKVSGYTPPNFSKTTIDGYAIETFEDTTALNGTINQLTLNPVELFINNTNGSTGTQQYGRYAPNTFEIYDHTSSGTNSSRLLVTSTDFDYQQAGSNPTFFPFKLGSAEIFRYDANGIKTASNKTIVLNNTGTGTNVISLLPNATADNPHIELTDGTTTNVITKNGMTTHNTNQNSTHFLNFVASSTTGTSQIQKTSGIECNPSTKTITATTFNGALSGTATSSTAISITDSTSTLEHFTLLL